MRVEASNQRWWIRPPMPDESLRSVLNRAAALYERTSEQIWECLNGDDPRPTGDVESPSCAALRRMAAAIGVSAFELLAHRQPDAPWLLAPQARNVYCPMCWNEDRIRGEPCSIRRGWNQLLRATCPHHGYPLRLAPEQWATLSLTHPFQVPQFSEREQRILDLIEYFGQTLEQSLYFGQPWPVGWQGNPQIARQTLLEVSFNVNTIRDFPLIKRVQASGGLAGFIRGPLHQQDPVRKLQWEAFREMADPALRRAAIWATAWAVMPDLPLDLSPGWFRLPTTYPSNEDGIGQGLDAVAAHC